MKINLINQLNQSFKAHFYKIQPNRPRAAEIQTDNNPKLGDKPYVVTSEFPDGIPMEKTGDKYSAEFATFNPIVTYHIAYKDTGKKDIKGGVGYRMDKKTMLQKANVFLRKKFNQPMIRAIKSGTTTGKLVVAEINDYDNLESLFNSIKEPSILLTSTIPTVPNNPNILGIIKTTDDVACFSHFATQLRNSIEVSGCIYSPEIIRKLEEFNGENIELSLKDNFVSFKRTDKKSKPKTYPKIKIPKLKYCDRILTSKEYSPDIIGAKAVNLRKLEELRKQRKISAIIPKSVALPYGYIENYLNSNDYEYCSYNDENYKDKTEDLKRVLKRNGITNPYIMIRSSFNGEDLADYSAAGLYKSVKVKNSDDKYLNGRIYRAIKTVKLSKDSETAKKSRARYQIAEEDIKPGIIIQNKIEEDYKFTLYTDDNSGNIKIDLYSKFDELKEDSIQPHSFSYNKKTGELKYNSIQMQNASVTFDENMNIVDSTPVTENLLNDKKLLDKLVEVCKNAMVIEREFGAPQDIEGGIKDKNIYIWQTRNIVNNI